MAETTFKAHHIDAPQLTLQEFRSVLGHHHELADSCRFVVQILRSEMGLDNDLMYLCHEAELPGRSLVTNDFRYYGPSFKMPLNSEFQPVTFSFICRDWMAEKYYFDDWLEKIQPKSTYDFAYRSSYATEINIFQISDIATGKKDYPMEALYKVTLRDAYPMSVDALPLSSEEEAYHKLRVTFTYTDWYNSEEKLKTEKFSLVEGAEVTRKSGSKLSTIYGV